MAQPVAAGALISLFLMACSDLTRPARQSTSEPAGGAAVAVPAASTAEARAEPQAVRAQASASPEPAADRPNAANAAQGAAAAPPSNAAETISAAHIVVAFAGAERSLFSLKRTKEEARQRANEILQRLLGGADFAELAREDSDGPSAPRGGDLGQFSRRQVEQAFAAAAFALQPGELSGIVETPLGFHIIKRTG